MKKIIYSLLFIMISSNIIFAQEKIEEKDEKKEKTNKNLPPYYALAYIMKV